MNNLFIYFPIWGCVSDIGYMFQGIALARRVEVFYGFSFQVAHDGKNMEIFLVFKK